MGRNTLHEIDFWHWDVEAHFPERELSELHRRPEASNFPNGTFL